MSIFSRQKQEKERVRSEGSVSRLFKYSKGNVNLNFTLTTDKIKEMQDFLECLDQSVKDVKDQIEKSHGLQTENTEQESAS